jgi:hypothetical protein
MMPRALIIIVIACLHMLGCDSDDTIERQSASGLETVVDNFLVDGHATPAAIRAAYPASTRTERSDSDRGIGLTWTVAPNQLQVFRSTAIHLRIDTPPKDHTGAVCSWNFGDGSPVIDGCTVSHTYHGGRADQLVTLTLTDGDWRWTSARTVPLERLTVTKGVTGKSAPDAGLPAAPSPAETSMRFAIIADTAAQGGVPASVTAGLESLVERVTPDLVIHAGGMATSDSTPDDRTKQRTQLNKLLGANDARIAWGRSPIDRRVGAELGRPNVQMIDERHYPDRYSFTFNGAYFLVVSAGGTQGVDESVIKWMREELSKAGIYDARYVVSYLPLHKFGGEHIGSLDKRFRLYELFLRARVTSFFSAGYRVYFSGHYGALPIVSVGALAGPGGTLAGSDFAQPNSYVVVDQVDGAKKRVFAVRGPTFDAQIDEAMLPDNVEVYTR